MALHTTIGSWRGWCFDILAVRDSRSPATSTERWGRVKYACICGCCEIHVSTLSSMAQNRTFALNWKFNWKSGLKDLSVILQVLHCFLRLATFKSIRSCSHYCHSALLHNYHALEGFLDEDIHRWDVALWLYGAPISGVNISWVAVECKSPALQAGRVLCFHSGSGCWLLDSTWMENHFRPDKRNGYLCQWTRLVWNAPAVLNDGFSGPSIVDFANDLFSDAALQLFNGTFSAIIAPS